MKIDNDDKQRAYVVSNFLIQAYKLIMGTFLVFFIPQKCGDHACTSLELVLHKNSIIDRSIQGTDSNGLLSTKLITNSENAHHHNNTLYLLQNNL